jgi:hypothetical protein
VLPLSRAPQQAAQTASRPPVRRPIDPEQRYQIAGQLVQRTGSAFVNAIEKRTYGVVQDEDVEVAVTRNAGLLGTAIEALQNELGNRGTPAQDIATLLLGGIFDTYRQLCQRFHPSTSSASNASRAAEGNGPAHQDAGAAIDDGLATWNTKLISSVRPLLAAQPVELGNLPPDVILFVEALSIIALKDMLKRINASVVPNEKSFFEALSKMEKLKQTYPTDGWTADAAIEMIDKHKLLSDEMDKLLRQQEAGVELCKPVEAILEKPLSGELSRVLATLRGRGFSMQFQGLYFALSDRLGALEMASKLASSQGAGKPHWAGELATMTKELRLLLTGIKDLMMDQQYNTPPFRPHRAQIYEMIRLRSNDLLVDFTHLEAKVLQASSNSTRTVTVQSPPLFEAVTASRLRGLSSGTGSSVSESPPSVAGGLDGYTRTATISSLRRVDKLLEEVGKVIDRAWHMYGRGAAPSLTKAPASTEQQLVDRFVQKYLLPQPRESDEVPEVGEPEASPTSVASSSVPTKSAASIPALGHSKRKRKGVRTSAKSSPAVNAAVAALDDVRFHRGRLMDCMTASEAWTQRSDWFMTKVREDVQDPGAPMSTPKAARYLEDAIHSIGKASSQLSQMLDAFEHAMVALDREDIRTGTAAPSSEFDEFKSNAEKQSSTLAQALADRCIEAEMLGRSQRAKVFRWCPTLADYQKLKEDPNISMRSAKVVSQRELPAINAAGFAKPAPDLLDVYVLTLRERLDASSPWTNSGKVEFHVHFDESSASAKPQAGHFKVFSDQTADRGTEVWRGRAALHELESLIKDMESLSLDQDP